MIDKLQIIRFTSNFPNLQGLKSIPISLWLLIITVWANQQQGETRNLTLPLLFSFAMVLFYWFIHQYYRLSFGEIKQTPRKKVSEILISIIAAGLALTAFYFDTAFDLPLCILGVLWVLLLGYDGSRIRAAFSRKPFPFFWIFAVILLFISLLPLLGMKGWWLKVGLQAQLYAILISVSIITFITGILWHLFLLRNLEIKA